MSANLDKKILAGLSREIKDYLPAIREGIDRFQDNTTQNEILDDTLRHIHTIKGASALMGLTALSQIASYMEEILEGIISGQSSFDTARQQWLSMTIDQIDPYLDALLRGEGENYEIVELIESSYLQISSVLHPKDVGIDAEIEDDLGEYEKNVTNLEVEEDSREVCIDLSDQEEEYNNSWTAQINSGDSDSDWGSNTGNAEELIEDISETDLNKDKTTIATRDSEIYYNDKIEDVNTDNDVSLGTDHGNFGIDNVENTNSLVIENSVESSNEYGEGDIVDSDSDITKIHQAESNQVDSLECIDQIVTSSELIRDSSENSNTDDSLYRNLSDEDEEDCEKSDESIVPDGVHELCTENPIDEIRENPDPCDDVNNLRPDNTTELAGLIGEIQNDDSQYVDFAAEESSTLNSHEEMVSDLDNNSEENIKSSNNLEKIVGQIDDQIKEVYETVDQRSFRPSYLLSLDHNQRHLLFTIGQSHYAATVENILEIGQVPSITPVPNVPGWLKGVINLRGEILSVIDLREFFDDRSSVKSGDERLVVVKTENGDVMTSLLVDQINGFALLETVLTNNVSDIFQDKATPYLSRIFELNGIIFATLDIESLLKSTEINQFY